jgi:sodium/potassium-transporting ATPase subunit alpha
VLILTIDLGTDIITAISFGHELGELDIMSRQPRRIDDHMVTRQMLTWAYMQVGWIQSFSGFFTYFIIMYDFGFLPESLPGLALTEGFQHAKGDFYDANHPTKGNSYVTGCSSGGDIEYTKDGAKGIPDWLYLKDLHTDLRMFYLKCVDGKVTEQFKWGKCVVKQMSNFSKQPICFTTESLKYAQTGFLFSIVMMQYLNAWVCKTR